MPIFQPEHVRLVEHALTDGPEEGMTGKQVWNATMRAVPEHTVHLILREMSHKGLVQRESIPKWGRLKAITAQVTARSPPSNRDFASSKLSMLPMSNQRLLNCVAKQGTRSTSHARKWPGAS